MDDTGPFDTAAHKYKAGFAYDPANEEIKDSLRRALIAGVLEVRELDAIMCDPFVRKVRRCKINRTDESCVVSAWLNRTDATCVESACRLKSSTPN